MLIGRFALTLALALLDLALCGNAGLSAEPLGQAPTYARRPLGPVPNGGAITLSIWAPGLDEGYVPQGLSVTGGALYVASYLRRGPRQNRGLCRLHRVSMTTGTVTATLDLPASCGHAGGLAKGPPGRLFVADTRTLYEVALAAPSQRMLGRIVRTITLAGGVKGSFAAGNDEAVWLGTFARKSEARLFKLPFSGLDARVTQADAVQVVPLPTEAQGAAFARNGALWIARSTSKFGELVRIDSATDAITARHAMPSGIEDLSFDETGALWAVSEAGAKPYSRWPTFFPVIFRIDTTKLR